MAERKRQLLNANALWVFALRALAGRAHSTGELREKLRRRAEQAGEVDAVLARLKDHGYLDDRRYAEGFATARLSNEQFGPGRVLRDLRQHRVAPSLAERTVASVYQDVNQTALIEAWIRRKYRLADRENLFREDADLASAYRRLLRAGFRTGDILLVLKRFARNPDLLDGFEPPEESLEE
jgi:regulatory protein